jgi:hypothetical protein
MSRASLALSISNDASFWLAVAEAGGDHISPHVMEDSARLAVYATLACSDTLRRPIPPNLGVREAWSNTWSFIVRPRIDAAAARTFSSNASASAGHTSKGVVLIKWVARTMEKDVLKRKKAA